MTQELSDKLCEIAVQTLADAFLLLIAGGLANMAIERFKSNQAIKVQASKERIKKLAEVWEQFNKLDELADKYIDEVICQAEKAVETGNSNDKEEVNKMGAKLKDKLKPVTKETDALLQLNRYWIGASAYRHFINYFTALSALIDSVEAWKFDSNVASRVKKLRESRPTIVDFLKNPDK